MTLEELEKTLPNGLHDAEVSRIIVDYKLRTMSLHIAVWVGDMDDLPEQREAYKHGRIDISGLFFLVMEPPDPKYPFQNSDLRIDGCDMTKNLNSELLRALPSGSFVRSLWVNEWNAFIHIAAREVQISWMNEGAITYRSSEEPIANTEKSTS